MIDDNTFVDSLIKDAGNSDSPAAQPAVKSPAGNTKAPVPADNENADAGAEHFDDNEYRDEEEGGEAFDHAAIDPARKAKWPKKYANAMSRRDKENARLKAENTAFQQRLAAMNGTQQPSGAADPAKAAGTAEQKKPSAKSAEMWELESKRPVLETFKDYAEYNEAVLEWKMDLRELTAKEASKAASQETANQKPATLTPEQHAAIVQNENRITQQATEIIKNNPEVFQIMQDNADLIDSLPQPIVNVIGSLQNPVVAMVHLAKHPGALEALRLLTPAQAAQVLHSAQAQGLAAMSATGGDDQPEGDQEPEQRKVSGAPVPMKAVKNSPSGGKALHQMDADQLDKELGFSNF